MKNNKLIILSILLTTFLCISCKGQTPLQLQQTYSAEIIGTWESENEQGHKLEFTQLGILKIYSENVHVGSMNYSIAISCNGQTNSDGTIFLKLEENGDIGCDVINAINNENSNILSITTEQGKLETYKKVD